VQRAFERQSLFDAVLAGADRLERTAELGRIDLGKEPETAQVHAQNWDARWSRERERPQDRAVTTRRDHQVGVGREALSRNLIGVRDPGWCLFGQRDQARATGSDPARDGREHLVAVPARMGHHPDRGQRPRRRCDRHELRPLRERELRVGPLINAPRRRRPPAACGR
jgi:hypothetical protein